MQCNELCSIWGSIAKSFIEIACAEMWHPFPLGLNLAIRSSNRVCRSRPASCKFPLHTFDRALIESWSFFGYRFSRCLLGHQTPSRVPPRTSGLGAPVPPPDPGSVWRFLDGRFIRVSFTAGLCGRKLRMRRCQIRDDDPSEHRRADGLPSGWHGGARQRFPGPSAWYRKTKGPFDAPQISR